VQWMLGLFVAVLLAGCGAPGVSQQDAQATAMARIEAGLNNGAPTAAPEPTLTALERDDMQSIVEYAKSITHSAQEIQALGQGIVANLEWETEVRANSSVMTAAQQAIEITGLPDMYAPLSKRAKEIAANCVKPIETIVAIDAGKMEIDDVSKHHDTIQRWCVAEMERLWLQVERL
jgi:hypothetical protein